MSLVAVLSAVFISKLYLILNLVFSNSKSLFSTSYIYSQAIELLAVTLATSTVIASGLYINKRLLDPLLRVGGIINKMRSEVKLHKFKVENASDEISQICYSFNELAFGLEQVNWDLETKCSELNEKECKITELMQSLDITYQNLNATSQKLDEMEQKYYSLVANIPEVVCVINKEGSVSFVNNVCHDVIGFDSSELLGKNFEDIIHPSTRTFSISKILKDLNDAQTVLMELHLVAKDGSKVITDAYFSKYLHEDMEVGLQVVLEDITLKRKMEEEIHQNTKELSVLNLVSSSLTTTLDFKQLSKLIVSEVSRTLNFEVCLLGFTDGIYSDIHIEACSGSYLPKVDDNGLMATFSLEEELFNRVIHKNEVVKTSNIPQNWVIGKLNNSKSKIGDLKELLYVPINAKNTRKGILAIGSSTVIKPNKVDLISSFANYVALAFDNAVLYETSKKYFVSTIDALIATVEAKDKYTRGHSQRVSNYAVNIAKYLGLPEDQVEDIKIAGILHDIGKIGISDEILCKPGKLTEEEYSKIKQHPAISNKILFPIGLSERVLKAIAYHHERFDGKGYPFGLAGENITIESQVIAVADAYDAMTSDRSYRSQMQIDQALIELRANAGNQFRHDVVDALINVVGFGNTQERLLA